ncbi:MAG: PAS domain-containing protein, partial [Nitrospinota bacterium]
MKTSSRLIALSVLLAAAVFLLDISIPLGVAGGVPYVVIVLVTMWSPKREFTIIMAVTGTVLTMAGFLLSPAGGEMWKVVINRLLALFAIWVTAVLILYHKRAETQIIESAKSLARAQEIANVGNWNYDIASKNVTWSDQLYRIYGFGPKEVTLTFQAFKNYIHPDDRDRVNNAIEVALKNEKPYDIDFRIVRKDGTQRVIHSQGEVEFDQEGRPIRMYGVAGDVTERKQAEEKLRLAMDKLAKANEEIKGFANIVSH